MNRKIGVIICMMLLLSMTFTVTNGQMIKKEKNEIIKYTNNSPPSNPLLTAPESIMKNRKFVIKATSNDPDNDQIYYRFKIGEDSSPRSWKGPYKSGYQFKLNVRIIGYSGDLIIGFQAKDTYNAESDWSYHTINYTKVKTRSLNYFNILDNFPRLSKIFQSVF
jgi:hypothetical protein